MDHLLNDYSNIPSFITSKFNKNLHNIKNHPLCIIKNHIYKYFDSLPTKFISFDDLSQIVTVKNNFDLLLIPEDHVSRSKSDTYYISEDLLLRSHTSAHQNDLISKGYQSFLVTGDVYRKDEVDSCHYPIFHQMEGVCLLHDNNPEEELKKILIGLINYLFPECEYRMSKDYFPFTDPSFEVEVLYNGKWLEILGCGVIHRKILDYHNIKRSGYAFGLGLERLAMILFDIPDIRLFWSNDTKFLNQFKEGSITKFQSFSLLDPITRDISFWINRDDVIIKDDTFSWDKINSFYELARETFLDDISNVILLDKFYHKKKDLYSHTFRLTFCPTNNLNNPAEFSKLTNDRMVIMNEISEKRLKITLR